eukprot:g3179.t1
MTQGANVKKHHRPTQQRHHYRTRSNNRPSSAGSTTTTAVQSRGDREHNGQQQHHYQQKKRNSLSDISRVKRRTQHRPSLDTCSSATSINIIHNNSIVSNENKFKSKHAQRNRITVAVRVRPLNSKELKERRIPVVRVSKQASGADPMVQISRLAKRGAYLKSEAAAHWEYGFDYAFNEKTEQETVYEKTVKPLVSDLLSGINSTVFAYVSKVNYYK